MPKQESTYFSPTCFFCGKNNKRRHSRAAKTWKCDHCHETNPGPSMLKRIIGHMASPIERAKNGAATTPAKVATTKLKTTKIAAAKPAKAAAAEPEPVKPPTPRKPAPKAAEAPATPPPTEKKRSGIAAVIWG